MKQNTTKKLERRFEVIGTIAGFIAGLIAFGANIDQCREALQSQT